MKHYVIQSHGEGEGWDIYNNLFSTDKSKLIEAVRKDLEDHCLMEPTTITESKEGWLLVNGKDDRWLRITELIECA